MDNDGIVIVYTGGGKGKTTAALGLALRAVGHKKKICMIQFIKGSWTYGEMDSCKRLAPEFELIRTGAGFVGIIDDTSPRSKHEEMAKEAVNISKKNITTNKYDIVILDEINYAVKMKLITVDDVISIIKEKHPSVDLVLTGNHAAPEVIELADLVTEMKEIKHPFKSGKRAKQGIDF